MKKTLAVLFLAITFAACNNESEKTPEVGKDSSDTTTPETPQSGVMANKGSTQTGKDSILPLPGDTVRAHH
jgi:hypothetical protein